MAAARHDNGEIVDLDLPSIGSACAAANGCLEIAGELKLTLDSSSVYKVICLTVGMKSSAFRT